MNKDLTSLKRNLGRNTGLQLGELLENWSEEFNDRSIVRLVRAVLLKNCQNEIILGRNSAVRKDRLNNLINVVPIFITESKNNVFVTGIWSL